MPQKQTNKESNGLHWSQESEQANIFDMKIFIFSSQSVLNEAFLKTNYSQ